MPSCVTGHEWYTLGRPAKAGSATNKPKWRNRQTRTTQNRVPSGNEGSIPSFGTHFVRLRSAPLALYPYGQFYWNIL